MKTVLTSIITSLITVIIALFVVHAIVGDGGCILSHDNDDKKECCVKKDHDKAEKHAMCKETLEPIRTEFETTLSDEEKATIAAIRENFGDEDHENLCPEGMEKYMEQHKDDIIALVTIADNHKEFFEGVFAKMHEKEHADEGEVVKEHACPEAAKYKEATEKCKGEKKTAEVAEKSEHAEDECKHAEEKCKSECMNTFKVHFLLMEAK